MACRQAWISIPRVILKAMNLPSSMFAVVTAVGRTVGWVAHWNEMHQAPLTIYRPRQIYVGEGYRDYVSRRGERSTGRSDWGEANASATFVVTYN
ncbi:Citrate synthase (si) [Klebsiella pneumoniae]|uniref:Citrate synthase (Si) n=1 Tax=Klebsiella pneumoniae TaxID=573 RepID=A0A2X3FF41_KLEPN|nr:Citrate synthase (si) [Klebsiella pneumoniae]